MVATSRKRPESAEKGARFETRGRRRETRERDGRGEIVREREGVQRERVESRKMGVQRDFEGEKLRERGGERDTGERLVFFDN